MQTGQYARDGLLRPAVQPVDPVRHAREVMQRPNCARGFCAGAQILTGVRSFALCCANRAYAGILDDSHTR